MALSFNPDDAYERTETVTATQNNEADDLLNDILAMLEDDRYSRLRGTLEDIYNRVSERGRCTSGQRDLIDTFMDRVERR